MKKLRIILVLMALTVMSGASAASLGNETLQYKILYKWGLVHKTAARATLKLTHSGANYNARLYAKTEPWADRVYHLRDTLKSTIVASTFRPTRYDKIAHEDGKFSHDIVQFSYAGNSVTGKCTRVRQKNPTEKRTTSNALLTSQGRTFDMLSVFYYLRTLDFASLKKNHVETMTIFSGKKKETLKVTYQGVTDVQVGKQKQKAYLITFTFTSNGKKSSDPIKAWLSADASHIPLRVEGALKIGKVIVELTGKN